MGLFHAGKIRLIPIIINKYECDKQFICLDTDFKIISLYFIVTWLVVSYIFKFQVNL